MVRRLRLLTVLLVGFATIVVLVWSPREGSRNDDSYDVDVSGHIARPPERIAAPGAVARPKPNVLLVTIDTLRPDHLTAYGYARATSPNLDRIAAEGVLFETAYAPMSTTGPSHATLFTSRYPLGHGVVRNGIPLSEELPVLPAILAEHGYRTAAFVSSYPVSRHFGFARGFAHFDDDFSGVASMGLASWNGRSVEGGFDRLGSDTVDRAIAWIATQAQDQPWFVWVHLFDPHAPYLAPAPRGETFKSPGATARQALVDAYDGEILYADTSLGRLSEASQADAGNRGLLTIVTSDHGEAFWEHGWNGHNRNLFDEEVRVPLIMHWRGRIAAGQRIGEPVSLVDLFPTVLAATEVVASDLTEDGIDLLPAIVGNRRIDSDRALYLQRPVRDRSPRRRHKPAASFGVRKGNWKLVNGRKARRSLLFDLEADPGETRDLSYAEPERAAELAAQIATWSQVEAANAPARDTNPVPEEVERKLRALGYAD